MASWWLLGIASLPVEVLFEEMTWTWWCRTSAEQMREWESLCALQLTSRVQTIRSVVLDSASCQERRRREKGKTDKQLFSLACRNSSACCYLKVDTKRLIPNNPYRVNLSSIYGAETGLTLITSNGFVFEPTEAYPLRLCMFLSKENLINAQERPTGPRHIRQSNRN